MRGLRTPAKMGMMTFVAQGKQGGDGLDPRGRHNVAAGSAWLIDQVLGADLAEVVGGLADGVAGVRLAGQGADLTGELGDREPVGRNGKGLNRAQCARVACSDLSRRSPTCRVGRTGGAGPGFDRRR